MGVFNTVEHPCNSCGEPVFWQSKVDGRCSTYTIRDVPAVVAGDIAGETAVCRKCLRAHKIHVTTIVKVE